MPLFAVAAQKEVPRRRKWCRASRHRCSATGDVHPVRRRTSRRRVPLRRSSSAYIPRRCSKNSLGRACDTSDQFRKKERRDDVATATDFRCGTVSCDRSHSIANVRGTVNRAGSSPTSRSATSTRSPSGVRGCVHPSPLLHASKASSEVKYWTSGIPRFSREAATAGGAMRIAPPPETDLAIHQ